LGVLDHIQGDFVAVDKVRQSWEAALMFRRLALIAIYAFVTESHIRLGFLTFGCVVAFAAQIHYAPFKSMVANVVEALSLCILVVIALLGLLIEGTAFKYGVVSTDSNAHFSILRGAQVVLVILPGAFVVFATLLALLVCLFGLGFTVCTAKSGFGRRCTIANSTSRLSEPLVFDADSNAEGVQIRSDPSFTAV